MLSLFQRIFGTTNAGGNAAPPRARLALTEQYDEIYAIGDVHGCLDLLLRIEERIAADAAADGRKLIVMLGDYVDRGPKSAAVLDHLLARPPPGFERICLAGNHDAMMATFCHRPWEAPEWLDLGGRETLLSYGIEAHSADRRTLNDRRFHQQLQASIPDEHLRFLSDLPIMLSTPGYAFVHAGLRPGVALADQTDDDLMWIRSEFTESPHDFGAVVVYGHTPVPTARISATQIALDTAAFASGVLSAARLPRSGPVTLLTT
jgi:serine/threonine protein phosphatase 1